MCGLRSSGASLVTCHYGKGVVLGSFHRTLLSLQPLVAQTEYLESLHKNLKARHQRASCRWLEILLRYRLSLFPNLSPGLPCLYFYISCHSSQQSREAPHQGGQGQKRHAAVTHSSPGDGYAFQVGSSSLVQSTLWWLISHCCHQILFVTRRTAVSFTRALTLDKLIPRRPLPIRDLALAVAFPWFLVLIDQDFCPGRSPRPETMP